MRLAQFINFIIGVFFISISIIISTDRGDEIFAQYNINLNNSAFREAFNLDMQGEDAQKKVEEPIYGILDVKSFIFIVSLLLGFFCVNVNFLEMIIILRHLATSPVAISMKIKYMADRLKKMSESYYKKDMDSFVKEVDIKKVPPVWSFIITQIELRQPLQNIVVLLKNEAILKKKSLDHHVSILTMLSNVAPSTGVLGTVLGLVRLLQNMKEPSSLGAGMSLALLTTFYGLFFSVVVFKYFSLRLHNLREAELRSYRIAAFWMNFLDKKLAAFYIEPEYVTKGAKKTK